MQEHSAEGEGNGRTPHLAHHFSSLKHQFESAKLGMWVFLITEILLFGGLFCAYAVFRSNHPEVFVYGHTFLDVNLGALNTAVLIFSSFTMALAVRYAQMGRRRALVCCLALTLICAFGFLGVKFVEYQHKWRHGLLWGEHYQSQVQHAEGEAGEQEGGPNLEADQGKTEDSIVGFSGEEAPSEDGPPESPETADTPVDSLPSADSLAGSGQAGQVEDPRFLKEERSLIPNAAIGPRGLAEQVAADVAEPHGIPEPPNVQLFFAIYFAMTGLHGIHVIAGIIMLIWLLVLATRGRFTENHFTAVDLGGLYWHMVDLIWIYLFPLFYLIH